jgi:flagellar motor switch protein FliN/FliY
MTISNTNDAAAKGEVSFSEPQGAIAASGNGALHLLRDVEVELTLEIGRRRMRIADVLKLASGQTLELTKAAGEPLDIFINGRLLGRGEAIVMGDKYGVRITELIAPNDARRT